jgi:hypothetical protein
MDRPRGRLIYSHVGPKLAPMRALRALALLTLAACGDDGPANVAGVYAMNFTAGANGCNLNNWMTGSTLTNVEVDLNQVSGSAEVTGTVKGGVGLFVAIVLGTSDFSGRVSGSDIEVLLTSIYDPTVMGACSFKYQLHLTGTLAGDILTGTLDITTVTNGSADCGAIAGCHSLETFNGSRAPTH